MVGWFVWFWFYFFLSCADGCGEVGLLTHYSASACEEVTISRPGPTSAMEASTPILQPLRAMYKAFSAACRNFVLSFQTSLVGTAYSGFAYSLSGFAVKLGTALLTLW